MRGEFEKDSIKPWRIAMALIILSAGWWMFCTVAAAQATAAINGVVRDTTGAAIPNARVDLTNVNTGVVRTTSTNNEGAYAFPTVVPGEYSMRASATGFATTSLPQTTLEVSQTATLDFQLTIGNTTQNVTVNGSEGAALETATSELGTVVNTKEVTDLPLNGRNFTQLLTITAGVANINRDQSAGGGGGWAGNSLGSFTFPAVRRCSEPQQLFPAGWGERPEHDRRHV